MSHSTHSSHTPHDDASEHPTSLLCMYALGALPDDEHRLVAQHIIACPACQEEVASFADVVALLPLSVPAPPPPPHIKRQLFARIEATRASEQLAQSTLRASAPAPATPPRRRLPAWAMGLMASLLVATLGLGWFATDQARQLSTVRAEFLAYQERNPNNSAQMVSFVMASDAVTHALEAQAEGSDLKMVMRPGHNQAALIIHGLPALSPGKHYQFWFARNGTPIPVKVFNTGADGSMMLMLEAPEPVEHYAEVMVTIEQDGTVNSPSGTIVASGSL